MLTDLGCLSQRKVEYHSGLSGEYPGTLTETPPPLLRGIAHPLQFKWEWGVLLSVGHAFLGALSCLSGDQGSSSP